MNNYSLSKFNEMVNYSLLRQQIDSVLDKPARRQLISSDKPSAYFEGDQEYNIWYHKHLTDSYDHSKPIREVALYKCNPELDSGYTKADTNTDHTSQFFCMYFARGSCTSGSNCTYRHRIPTELDELWIDAGKDVFGRERHGSHRDDMSGVGSFNHDCTTIFVGGLQYDRGLINGGEILERTLWEEFGKWGRIISLKLILTKCIAFIKYATRLQAEFAKVAMADQALGSHSQILTVRWAYHFNKKEEDNSQPKPSKSEDKNITSLEKMYNLHETLYNIALNCYQQFLTNLSTEELNDHSLLEQIWARAYTQAWTLYNSSNKSHCYDTDISETIPYEQYDYVYNSNLNSTSHSSVQTDNHNTDQSNSNFDSIGPITKDHYNEIEKSAKTSEDISRMKSILDTIEETDEENFFIEIK